MLEGLIRPQELSLWFIRPSHPQQCFSIIGNTFKVDFRDAVNVCAAHIFELFRFLFQLFLLVFASNSLESDSLRSLLVVHFSREPHIVAIM